MIPSIRDDQRLLGEAYVKNVLKENNALLGNGGTPNTPKTAEAFSKQNEWIYIEDLAGRGSPVRSTEILTGTLEQVVELAVRKYQGSGNPQMDKEDGIDWSEITRATLRNLQDLGNGVYFSDITQDGEVLAYFIQK